MRKLLLILAVVLLSAAAFDASACSRCGTRPDGCAFCYESSNNGAQDCYLWQGEHCALVDAGQCQGYGGGDGCVGEHCEFEIEALRDESPSRDWQLASVEVIRPRARTAS